MTEAKPHIRRAPGRWEICRSRFEVERLIGLASRFERLKARGPWASCEVDRSTYVGDAKNPI